ncbi:hypothetical protein U1Q18_028586 [Sarracenia purpurea var. burkii]
MTAGGGSQAAGVIATFKAKEVHKVLAAKSVFLEVFDPVRRVFGDFGAVESGFPSHYLPTMVCNARRISQNRNFLFLGNQRRIDLVWWGRVVRNFVS